MPLPCHTGPHGGTVLVVGTVDDQHVLRQAGCQAGLSRQRAHGATRRMHRRKLVARNARHVQQSFVPVLGGDVHELSDAGVRGIHAQVSRQPADNKVVDKEEMARRCKVGGAILPKPANVLQGQAATQVPTSGAVDKIRTPSCFHTLSLLSGDGRFEDLAGNDLDGEWNLPSPYGVPSGDGLAGGLVDWDADREIVGVVADTCFRDGGLVLFLS